jgi:hypothetical protein
VGFTWLVLCWFYDIDIGLFRLIVQDCRDLLQLSYVELVSRRFIQIPICVRFLSTWNNNIFVVTENFGIPCQSSLFIFANVGLNEAFIVPAMATMTGSMNNLKSDLINMKKFFPNPARNYKSELLKYSFIFVNREGNEMIMF